MKTEHTDEQLNIAVCKFIGWTNTQIIEASDDNPRLVKGNSPDGKWFAVLPNHITGIEALGHLHEAEKLLSEAETTAYIDELERVTRENGMVRAVERRLTKAEPRHKAIALLSAVNQLPD